MAYTVAELVTEAWYLSGIVSEEQETVSGSQMTKGVRLLNAFLAIKTVSNRLIPYFSKYTTDVEVGEEVYFIPNLINIETLSFFISNVRKSTSSQGRKQFFGSDRVAGVNSLPFNWHAERTKGGTNLYLYFQPDAAYPLEIWGKFSLGSVTVDQDLSPILDDFYIEYLRYGLDQRMCQAYGVTFEHQKELDELEAAMSNISPPDLTMQKTSTLQGPGIGMWGYVNLGRGWA